MRKLICSDCVKSWFPGRSTDSAKMDHIGSASEVDGVTSSENR